jgi:hypothetical protein
VRHAFCTGAVVTHTGNAAAFPAKFACSAAVGAYAGSSPPPDAITALFSVIDPDPAVAVAAIDTGTVIDGAVDAAAIAAVAVQVNAESPRAPLQVHPLPDGAAASTIPVGSRS